MGDEIYKCHDHGVVGAIYNVTEKCMVSGHYHSYMRIGLYYRTKKAPQNFCDIHLLWGTSPEFVTTSWAYYTGAEDSVLTIDTTRNPGDSILFNNGGELPVDAMGHVIMSDPDYSPRLDVSDGGKVVYFGNPRPDAEQLIVWKHTNDRKGHPVGKDHPRYRDYIGKKRSLECWLLGPVFLFDGDQMSGSLVVKLEGRFEAGLGFQHCSLWESHYVNDGTLEKPAEAAADQIRKAVSAKGLPAFASGIVWKVEQ